MTTPIISFTATMPASVGTFSAWRLRFPALVVAAGINAVLLAAMLVGLVVDDRLVVGAPVWLKPVKFAASISVYLLSLAWMFDGLPVSAGVRRACTLIAGMLTLEVLLISLQAARGTTSHFNADTMFDGAVFSIMGGAIGLVWLASMYLLWRHARTRVPDRTLAMAFRVGLALNILGAGVGWRMTQPTPDQLQAIAEGVRPRVVGRHSVGGVDGGPGMPITRWSTAHGDLRVPHFLGMHALQWLPLFVLMLRALRSRANDRVEQIALAVASSASVLLFGAALIQALMGVPLLSSHGGGP